jgi:hypothetical protein
MLLLIGYAGPQESRVQKEIHERASAHLRPLPSQDLWLAETDEDVDAWADRLSEFMTSPERLLILRVTGRTNGWLPSDAWDWINPRAR